MCGPRGGKWRKAKSQTVCLYFWSISSQILGKDTKGREGQRDVGNPGARGLPCSSGHSLGKLQPLQQSHTFSVFSMQNGQLWLIWNICRNGLSKWAYASTCGSVACACHLERLESSCSTYRCCTNAKKTRKGIGSGQGLYRMWGLCGVYSMAYPLQQWAQGGNRWDQSQSAGRPANWTSWTRVYQCQSIFASSLQALSKGLGDEVINIRERKDITYWD